MNKFLEIIDWLYTMKARFDEETLLLAAHAFETTTL
jgi:hypothetical protein